MGKSDYSRTVAGSDSGYGGDEATDRSSSSLHPLGIKARKGYEIGPASKLQIGDVFEFLWADCPEFEYEWKCLGYTRFIVLRHSDSFPMHCACVPISVGNKRNFAKPGIDTLQQGHVYASGDRDRDRDSADPQTPSQHDKAHSQLPYSSVGINLHGGRHKVKEDSRANYADVVEIDHEAQVMVIGDVVKYFDRVRKNVNKAFMRQILRDALGDYCERKRSESEAAGTRGWGNSTVSLIKTAENHPNGDEPVPDEANAVNDKQPEDVPPEDVPPEDVQHENSQPDDVQPERMPMEQPPPAVANPMEREAEESDDAKEDVEDSGQPSTSTSHPHPPRTADSRAARTESRARTHSRTRSRNHSRAASPAREAQVGLKPGMDRAGLQSLRNLRRGAASEDHDDTLSLRSLAMVGRTDSGSSRRSRR